MDKELLMQAIELAGLGPGIGDVPRFGNGNDGNGKHVEKMLGNIWFLGKGQQECTLDYYTIVL